MGDLERALAVISAQAEQLTQAQARIAQVEAERDLWREDARRYCSNADYWRERCLTAERERDELREAVCKDRNAERRLLRWEEAERERDEAKEWDVRSFWKSVQELDCGLSHEQGWTLMATVDAENLKCQCAALRETLSTARIVLDHAGSFIGFAPWQAGPGIIEKMIAEIDAALAAKGEGDG